MKIVASLWSLGLILWLQEGSRDVIVEYFSRVLKGSTITPRFYQLDISLRILDNLDFDRKDIFSHVVTPCSRYM